ncbi:CBS domain-containing protein, partial [Streptomyces sp. NPDC020766]|uniref:CBS domain-containing protein n=1 Tax=Streptomyces sp. NPDC020766 TaxID=3155011 RepID=UPI0033CB7293
FNRGASPEGGGAAPPPPPHAVRRLPVVEDGQAVGMVTLGDLAIAENPDSALAEISRAAPYGPGGRTGM